MRFIALYKNLHRALGPYCSFWSGLTGLTLGTLLFNKKNKILLTFSMFLMFYRRHSKILSQNLVISINKIKSIKILFFLLRIILLQRKKTTFHQYWFLFFILVNSNSLYIHLSKICHRTPRYQSSGQKWVLYWYRIKFFFYGWTRVAK